MIDYTYKSIFAPFFRDFIHVKETMGFATPKIEYILKELDTFFLGKGVGEPIIKKEMLIAWREGKANESERTLYDKWSIISQFSRYMCHLGFPCYVPHMPKRNSGSWSYIPYIFTHGQMADLFRASDAMVMPYNNMESKMFCIPALLRTLYGTGMRIGEACSLANRDVDLQKAQILIRKTKNQQQRIVPICQSLASALEQYKRYRDRIEISGISLPDACFFVAPNGRGLSLGSMYNWFRKLLKACGIPFVGGNHGPRVHDIRHTFAVHSLMQQVRAGADIYCALPILSVYLGHKTLAGTERYVRLTQEMFPDIINLEESVSSYVFPSISLMKRANE